MLPKEHYEKYNCSWSEDSIWMIITPGLSARSIYLYPQEVGYFSSGSDYFTERQKLHSFLIIYTLSGSGSLNYRKTDYTLSAGSLCLIDCMEYHLYKTTSTEPWEFLWVHFNGVTALGYFKEFEKNGFCVPTDIENPGSFEEAIRRLIAINRERNYTTDPINSNILHSMLTELLIRTNADSTATISIPEPIRQAAIFLDKRFSEKITLPELSRRCGISKYHLSREFKKWYGKTIIEYLTDNRVSYAKELLRYSDLSIDRIAEDCGIANMGHFIRQFRIREGCTPRAYKKAWRSN